MPQNAKGVTKSQSKCDKSSLQQNRRRRKKTLTNKLREYCEKCAGDVYLLIMEDNRCFTVKFTVDTTSTENFPPPDDLLVCVCPSFYQHYTNLG
jgi:hypothetical protein